MDSKIIEMVGPPGIGKTTLYESLCRAWHPSATWIYQEALLNPEPPFTAPGKWMVYHAKKLLGQKIAKSIPIDNGLRFIEHHPELSDFLWSHLSDSRTYTGNETDKRFRAAYFLFLDFCRYQAISQHASLKPCLVNEGLLQKSFFINEEEAYVLDRITKYTSLLPLPRAVIYMDTPDKSVILRRLQARKKVIASHWGKDEPALLRDIEKWQHTLKATLKKLQAQNVPICYIDGTRPLDENVLSVMNILSQL